MGLPVVSWLYRTAADMPIPCCPRLCLMAWKREPYRSLANVLGICSLTMPGPLSSIIIATLSPPASSMLTMISGSIPASSHASRELSTPSLTAVSRLRGAESKPSICLFFSKNSAILMARCFFASSSAIGTATNLSPLQIRN